MPFDTHQASIKPPSRDGTSIGEVGATADDGQYTWDGRNWIWHRSQASRDDEANQHVHIQMDNEGTPTPAQLGGDMSDTRSLEQQLLGGLGLIPRQVDSSAPGGSLDTSNAQGDRARLQSLVAQLQQQAATGDGDWQKTLDASTKATQATSQALGETQNAQGGGYQSALRNIGNAQSAAAQQGVGQGNVLRAQQRQSAQEQLGSTLAAQGQQDAGQAAAESAANQGVRQLNSALLQQWRQGMSGVAGGVGTVAAMLSSGGPVPGRATIFGDDETNDTVPAMLSPGEIVIPRSIAKDDDAAARAADFVRAVKAHGAKRLAGGGEPQREDSTGIRDIDIGQAIKDSGKEEAASVENGGLLDTSNFAASRDSTLGLADQLAQSPLASGQSAAPQLTTNAQDQSIAQALAAMQHGRPTDGASMLTASATEQQAGGANAAARSGSEQAKQQQLLAQTLSGQRQRELAMAQAQQQAGFRNTEMNAGLALQNQQFLQNILSGAGQAAVSLARAAGSSDGGGDDDNDPFTEDDFTPGSSAFNVESPSKSSGDDAESDWRGGLVGNHMADGGEVHAKEFAKALARKKAAETPDEVRRRKAQEYDEEEGGARPGPDMSATIALRQLDKNQHDVVMPPKETLDMWRAMAARESGTRQAPDEGMMARAAHALRTAISPTPAPEAQPLSPEYKQMLAEYDVAQDKRAREAVPAGTGSRIVDGLRGVARSASSVLPHFADGGMTDERPMISDSGPMYAPVDFGGDSRKLPPAAVREVLAQIDAAKDSPVASGAPISDAPLSMQAFAPGMTGGPPDDTPKGSMLSPADYALRTTRGLRRMQDIPDAPQIALTPAAATSGLPSIDIRLPGGGNSSALDKRNENAITAAADLEAQAAHAKAVGMAEQQKVADAYVLKQKQVHDTARARTSEAMNAVKQAHDEMGRIDATVDPGRFWASRTTGQKILGIIGLALGAIGAGTDGINRAAGMMTQAIDRDVEAQKAEHEIRLKKGAGRIEGAKTFYSMARELGADDVAATDLAKAGALEAAASRTAQAVAGIQEPVAKARGEQLVVAAKQEAAAKRAAAGQRTFDNELKLEHEKTERGVAGARQAGLSSEERSKTIDVQSTAENIRRNVDIAKKLIEKKGTFELTGTEQTELQRALGEAAQDWARLRDPGSTVKDAELENAKRQLGVSGGELITSNDTAQKLLDSFRSSVDERENIAYRVRGLPPPRRAAP